MQDSIPAATETTSGEHPSSCPAPNGTLQSLVAGFALLDLFTIPVMAGVVGNGGGGHVEFLVVAVGTTALIAQGALLAVWGVLGGQPLVLRLPLSILGAMLLYSVVSLATIAVPMQNSGEGAGVLAVVLLVPLLVLVVQGPIWLLRALFEWARFDRHGNELTQARASRQFSLTDMLVLTAVIAIALGFSQAFAKLTLGAAGAPADSYLWMVVLYPIVLAMILSIFLLLPCLIACLVLQSVSFGRVGLAVYGLILVFGVTSLAVFGGAPAELIAFAFFAALVFVGVWLLVVGTTLSVVRGLGYRLLGRRKSTAPPQHGRRPDGCPFAGETFAKKAGDDPFASTN